MKTVKTVNGFNWIVVFMAWSKRQFFFANEILSKINLLNRRKDHD
jgi:hypothetical protein